MMGRQDEVVLRVSGPTAAATERATTELERVLRRSFPLLGLERRSDQPAQSLGSTLMLLGGGAGLTGLANVLIAWYSARRGVGFEVEAGGERLSVDGLDRRTALQLVEEFFQRHDDA